MWTVDLYAESSLCSVKETTMFHNFDEFNGFFQSCSWKFGSCLSKRASKLRKTTVITYLSCRRVSTWDSIWMFGVFILKDGRRYRRCLLNADCNWQLVLGYYPDRRTQHCAGKRGIMISDSLLDRLLFHQLFQYRFSIITITFSHTLLHSEPCIIPISRDTQNLSQLIICTHHTGRRRLNSTLLNNNHTSHSDRRRTHTHTHLFLQYNDMVFLILAVVVAAAAASATTSIFY